MRIRKRVFVGCEGDSERSYVRWLQRRSDELDLHLHFDGWPAHGGDPLAIVISSIAKMRERSARHGPYTAAAVLFDADKLGITPARDKQIPRLTRQANMAVLAQTFDHEAILLRHFQGCKTLRPPAGKSLPRLRREWPEYSKPADALQLEARIDLAGLFRMISVEPAFARFLSSKLHFRR